MLTFTRVRSDFGTPNLWVDPEQVAAVERFVETCTGQPQAILHMTSGQFFHVRDDKLDVVRRIVDYRNSMRHDRGDSSK